MRVLKSRGTLEQGGVKHADLVSEVVSQLQFFTPTGRQVKQVIEDLLKLKYVQRHPSDPDAYIYSP
jgi:hypothetical protein